MLFVNHFLPSEKGFGEALFMKINKSKFDSIHGVVIEPYILLPDTKTSVHNVLVSLHKVSE